ncbi:NAD(P)-dependent oxidoreductase [Pontibacillus yanchengensis]|uniref:Oxidoreductase n=1 Tax=Pontibacillus yanchengensis Y32 TaxID=1385514 RepID=A0A0A2TQ42_9BACI|nr:NAD(P)-dependent oxidoreductase [Pontibacillus yanchengensis]KGP71405.1 oxidoreductase [Pontibacillus yanchengensis Y32]
MAKPRIGFIGTGVMGKSMAKRLMDEGYPLHIYTRTYEKAEELIEAGAFWKEKVKDIASESDIIITMVGYPDDVEEVYYGQDGLMDNAKQGTYLIDMTTSSPEIAMDIHDKATTKGLIVMDAPVSGGDIGAKNGNLSIMVGGNAEAFEQMKPVFNIMGSNVVLQGEAGAGQYTKMCNQIAIASNMMGVCEALIYAESAGLDPDTVLQSISGGAAGSWSLTNLAPRMIAEDFSPGFFVKHFIKDMGIAIESTERMGLDLPGLQLAKELYDKIAEDGEGDSGTQALYKYYKLNS